MWLWVACAGQPEPLGASEAAKGVNFALSAPAATSVLLCLFDEAGEPMGEELALEKDADGVWTGLVQGLPKKGVLYGCVCRLLATKQTLTTSRASTPQTGVRVIKASL